MTMERPRRTFSERPAGGRRGARDVDVAGRAQKLHALGWALFAGVPLGGVAGYAFGGLLLGSGLLGAVLGLFLGPLLIWGVALGLAAVAGRGAGVVYSPTGTSTPRKKEYSYAESLVARGELEEAVVAYQVAATNDPGDPEPFLRIARLHRDGLEEPLEAVTWFRKALRHAQLSRGQEMRALREIAEIFLHHIGEPRKAAPELARLAERFSTTPDGEWAARELGLVKEEMARDEDR